MGGIPRAAAAFSSKSRCQGVQTTGVKPRLIDRIRFPGKYSGHHQDARLRTNRAHGGSLLGGGHTQPLGPGAGQQRRACEHIVAIGVGLDHRHQIGLPACYAAQFLIVGQQPLAGDFRPKRSVCHELISILRAPHQRPCSQSECNPPGRPDAPSRWAHCVVWR